MDRFLSYKVQSKTKKNERVHQTAYEWTIVMISLMAIDRYLFGSFPHQHVQFELLAIVMNFGRSICTCVVIFSHFTSGSGSVRLFLFVACSFKSFHLLFLFCNRLNNRYVPPNCKAISLVGVFLLFVSQIQFYFAYIE